MHSRTHGKAQTLKPFVKENPKWLKLKSEEIIERIIKLAKEGYSTSIIGMILRDSYGVPSVKLATGKSITEILKENKLMKPLPEDLLNLMKKIIVLKEHIKKHPKDYSNKRGFTLTESKIRRLVKYYKRTGVLPEEWKYSAETVELLIK